MDLRDAFFGEVHEIARRDPHVTFITADMGAWSLTRFRKELPDQFLNVGISEQNMVSVAAGLALGGQRVFVYAIAPFLALRCLEQIKVDLCQMNLPVTLAAGGPGFTYASDGPTHHAIEDVAVMRVLPNLTIYNPSDPTTMQAAARSAYENDGPTYVRIDKGQQPCLHPGNCLYEHGANRLRPGSDVLILSTGVMTHIACRVVDGLRKRNINAGVVDVFRLKPLDHDWLCHEIQQYHSVVTLEEHITHGGFGSLIVEALCDQELRVRVKRIGLPDVYPTAYGSRQWLQRSYGLDPTTLVDEIAHWYQGPAQGTRNSFCHEITESDFADDCGVCVEQLPEESRDLIARYDFRYRVAEGEEREMLLLRAAKALAANLPVSGPQRLADWENGWRENLAAFVANNCDPKQLVPKFVKKNEFIRYRGNYIHPANENFETCYVDVLRQIVFDRYLGSFKRVYEFGAGTGHNLLALAQCDPSKELVGLDWAESSCELISRISNVCDFNLRAVRFDMFHPDATVPLDGTCAVFTVGTMEQLGNNFDPFLDFLLEKKTGLCLNIETLHELYDETDLFDYMAQKYLDKRGYLRGYLTRLRELEREGRIEILAVRRTFGSFFHDGYSFVVWRPSS